MPFRYLTNIPPETALSDYLHLMLDAGMAARSETIPVPSSAGRVTARAVRAHICSPHYPAGAMDGIALDSRRSFGATETTPVILETGQYTVVDTGDPVPDGCDAVIMIEDVERLPDGGVRIYAPAVPWQHIRQIGEDICAGDMILPSRTLITPAAVGAMLAGGVQEVTVLAQPVIGIIPTGDEIIRPVADPPPGKIMEFNSAIFSSMLADWRARAHIFPIQPDVADSIRDALLSALKICDMVLLIAGSSAGREDYTADVIGSLGEILYHGVAIKPGKPVILGRSGPRPVIGLPGYPVSGILVMEQFVKPLIDAWYGLTPEQPETCEARLARSVLSGLKYKEFVRVRLGAVDGKLIASPLNRGSGVISSFVKADGIMEIPQNTEGYEAGATVRVRLLRPRSELANTLVVTGSHDPLLDELADLMRLSDPSMRVSSSHVGSMGGIMAMRRRENHAAGIHLLDETGTGYNVSFVRRYFPDGGVQLIECVGRIQGLMLQKGNPLGLTGFGDLTRSGVRYVNRQKGSGTRILADSLCGQNGISPDEINGYAREEFTHTAVAAQIAAGSADAGLGILSAAKLYGLDFVPICTEQYDLLIPDYARDLPATRKLLEILSGDGFRARLTALGGYTLDRPGRVRERF